MSKAKAKAKQIKGKMKESVGDMTDDKRMEAEGRGEQMTGKMQEAAAKTGERMKKPGK
ncbi:CsbD family protein [Streptomyces venezuelae]|uniref:CsbD family protein n=1 Tax=Streptomyces venezuelae TaxID=54571 RepID=A0A5P2DAS5_STRVZ|nr:CsbD family protein [Streptomyces venezuelae]QES51307.1 CsbD family protein [Streptomyces venezuelae]